MRNMVYELDVIRKAGRAIVQNDPEERGFFSSHTTER
jgi:hypothetical protein